jgi:hypothetical protein
MSSAEASTQAQTQDATDTLRP